MRRDTLKQKLYDITRFYYSDTIKTKKVSSYVVRDCLYKVFSGKCPNEVFRDLDSIIVSYNKLNYSLEYKIKKNVSDNTCYVNQSLYCNDDLIDEDKYIVHFPIDLKLFKSKVKNDIQKFEVI